VNLGSPGSDTTPTNIWDNNNLRYIAQFGSTADNTFGQYKYTNESVQRERSGTRNNYRYAYNGRYTPYIYGRLSILRPQGISTPIFGLYAMRGWDFGNSGRDDAVYDSTNNSSKRFLTVVQGLRLPYYPLDGLPGSPTEGPRGDKNFLRVWPNTTNAQDYAAERDRILGFRFWNNTNQGTTEEPIYSTIRLYDTWIGEGFSPREVRAILGLTTTNSADIRNTYVEPELEAQGFYVPEGYVPGGTNP
jgi:hypothetical protein